MCIRDRSYTIPANNKEKTMKDITEYSTDRAYINCPDCGKIALPQNRPGLFLCEDDECGRSFRACADCDHIFVLTPDKPGRVDQCAVCGEENEVERLKGITINEGKNTRSTVIVPGAVADEFNRLSRVSSIATH